MIFINLLIIPDDVKKGSRGSILDGKHCAEKHVQENKKTFYFNER